MAKDSQIDSKAARDAKAQCGTSFSASTADNATNNSKKQSAKSKKPKNGK